MLADQAMARRARPRATARPRMPGTEGFFVFLGGDLAVFTLLFAAYLVARRDDPLGFGTAVADLDVNRGGLYTILLIVSSWTVALALHDFRAGRLARCRRLVAYGVAAGACFTVIKVIDVAVLLAEGISGHFYVYFLGITLLHLLHVLVGCSLLSVYRARIGRAHVSERSFESVACYWHAVDLLWIIIFPLLYMLR